MIDRRKPLLIVEDDLALQKQLRWALADYECVTAQNCEQALAQMRRHEPAVVTLDLGLPPQPDRPDEGLSTLREILALAPDTKVIVASGQTERANAVTAIADGAYDFYAKPFEPEVLTLTVERAFRLYELQRDHRRLQERSAQTALGGLITSDPEMLRLARMVEKVAATSATVMVLGESGTGKELMARAIHDQSARRDAPFVAINCAAIPDTLLESELFGFEKGAFTGAIRQSTGKIEAAHRGTLFLDEIGDLPLALQAKLLRFLQERTIERLGGRQRIAVDVRVICATHQNLSALIAQQRFREDIYYRLAEIVFEIPPLRERPGDASLLAHAFARRVAAEVHRAKVTLSADALAALEAHTWPGNVRELQNVIKRAVILADSNVIAAKDLGLACTAHSPEDLTLRRVREEAERRAVGRALARANGNLSKAAELLGVSRPTLYDLLDRFDLRGDRTSSELEQPAGV